jgi:hypothetical protein
MMGRARGSTSRLFLLPLAALLCQIGLAGTLPLEWNPVQEQDVQGYYVYYGSAAGVYESREYTTATTLDLSLADCPANAYHVAVKAWNGSQESETFSNEVVGLPTPFLTANELVPSQGEQGGTLTVRAEGWNFVPGATVVFQFDEPGVTVSSTRVYSCRQVEATITIAETAALGPTAVTLTVDNPDGTYTSGSLSFEVVEPPEMFAVLGATPPDSSTDVDPGTEVQVRFNSPLKPKKVTGDRFKIKRVGPPGRGKGKARLATGSPRLEADGTTVTMTLKKPLAGNERYAVWVKGGRKGVKDVNGDALPSSWIQAPGFVSRAFLEDISFGDSLTGGGSSLVPSSEVPTDSIFLVEFSEEVDASSVTNTSVMIKWPGTGKIPLAGGKPRLSADGRSIIVEPAGVLPSGTNLKLIVKGRSVGVKSARGVILTESKITTEFTTPVGSVSSMGVAE